MIVECHVTSWSVNSAVPLGDFHEQWCGLLWSQLILFFTDVFVTVLHCSSLFVIVRYCSEHFRAVVFSSKFQYNLQKRKKKTKAPTQQISNDAHCAVRILLFAIENILDLKIRTGADPHQSGLCTEKLKSVQCNFLRAEIFLTAIKSLLCCIILCIRHRFFLLRTSCARDSEKLPLKYM